MDRPGGRDPLVGRLLDGRYLVGARIARGGMATVYEATDLRLDRTVALKVMPHALAEDDDFSQRFVREARAAARLTHPNVVAVYDQGEDDGVLFLAMEFVGGRHTLRDVIREDAPLEPIRALRLLEKILEAISFAHESGIIHRDIKPENVLIDPRGQLKVADFGLARAVSAATAATATGGVLMGTVSYLPPELVTDGTSDTRSDVYSLGVLAFELLTGTKPHAGDSPIQIAYKLVHHDVPAPSSVVEGIPAYLDAFVARATSRSRELRPADAHVMLQQLGRVRHALERGVVDDPELTDDLTPTIALGQSLGSSVGPSLGRPGATPGAATARPGSLFAESSASSSRDEVFDLASYDDLDSRVDVHAENPGPEFVPAGERTRVVGEAAHLSVWAPGGTSSSDRVGHPHGSTAVDQALTAGTPRRSASDRRRRRGWVAFVVVVLLAAGAALAGWYYGVGRFTQTPNVVELTRTQAARKVHAAGLTLQVAGSTFSETVRAGNVVSTDPGPGDDVLKNGGVVTAWISKGPERHKVPHLSGLSEPDAITAITDSSLTVGSTTRAWSETVNAGVVISSTPKMDTLLARDDPVQLLVSKGPKPLTLHDHADGEGTTARAELTRLGFDVTVVRQYDDNVPQGAVISQEPSHGVGYAGDPVTLVVSRGPHLVEVPNVDRFGISDAESALAAKGFKVTTEQFQPYLGLGFVVGESPGAGEMAPYGSTVVLTVV